MKILKLSSQEIKIIYSPAQERVCLGDVFKIADNRVPLIAQVCEISSQAEGSLSNIANLKILFSIQQNDWTNWNGEMPSVDASIEKITKQEFLKQFNALNAPKPVYIGNLLQYSNAKFAPGLNALKEPCVVFADRQNEKQDLLSLFASELLNNEQKIVILDFTGEYSDVETTKIKAGFDFKLPLSAKGIDKIYAKGFEGASVESRAVIEDVFIEVGEYAKTCIEGFIPFSKFKSVVDKTYEQNRITQLVLLKNRLLKYEQSGIFADNEQEINALKIALNNDNLVVVDLSEISVEWQKDFVDNIISSNIDKNYQKFYLAVDINSDNFDVQLLNKLFVKGFKSGIFPILTAAYNTPFVENLLNYAKNLFLFKPVKNLPDSIMGIFSYISKLNTKEYIICGEITKYMPVFANISQEMPEQSVEELQPNTEINEEYGFYSPQPEKTDEQNFEEIELDDVAEKNILKEEPVGFSQQNDDEFLDMAQETPEQSVEELQLHTEINEKYGFYSPQPEKTDERKFEEIDFDDVIEENISKEITGQTQQSFLRHSELVSESHNHEMLKQVRNDVRVLEGADLLPKEQPVDFSQQNDDDEFLDMAQEVSENEGEYVEFEDEEFSFCDEEIKKPQPQVYENEVKEKISKDVDELYTTPKIDEEIQIQPSRTKIPVYSADYNQDKKEFVFDIEEGDIVRHQKYGTGVVKKIISYGNKKLCSIHFDNVGRRLLDPELAVIEKVYS